nr:MAG TPA: hypothetical protein [Caudoviricetes sp.]
MLNPQLHRTSKIHTPLNLCYNKKFSVKNWGKLIKKFILVLFLL